MASTNVTRISYRGEGSEGRGGELGFPLQENNIFHLLNKIALTYNKNINTIEIFVFIR